MSFSQVEGFFVDACVLLPHASETVRESCLSFLKENASRCILASSVKEEALELIEKSYTFIISSLHSELKPFLEKQGIKELSNKHGKFMAQFFMERRRELKKQFKSNVPREMIGALENYVATRLHSLSSGQKISVDDFLAALTTELGVSKHHLKAPFMGIRDIEIVPDNSIVSQIVVGAFILNQNDAKHLASALIYQFKQNKWVIFVTIDETEILSKTDELFNIFALQCSSPEWASDYYDELTKLNAPVEYFKALTTYSNVQREFANSIERITGKKIIA